MALFVPGFFLTLPLTVPCVLVWQGIVHARKRWQFPYAMAPLRKRLQSFYGKRRDVRLYLGGLIHGYHRPAIYAPPFSARDLARLDGLDDGTALREGKIAFEELPSRSARFGSAWSRPIRNPGSL